jgi:hypothetical protein
MDFKHDRKEKSSSKKKGNNRGHLKSEKNIYCVKLKALKRIKVGKLGAETIR